MNVAAGDRSPRTTRRAPHAGRGPPLRVPPLFEGPTVGGRRRPAPLGGDAGHAGAAEVVENDVAGLRVVEDGRDDREVRHLGVVAVGAVESVGLAGADVDGERLAVIRLVGVVRPAVVLDELGQERIGARGVVRRVGQAQDVLVVRHGEVGPLPQLGELLLQLGAEVLAARRVRLEGQPEARHLRGVLRRGGLRQQAGGRIPLGSHGNPLARSTVPPHRGRDTGFGQHIPLVGRAGLGRIRHADDSRFEKRLQVLPPEVCPVLRPGACQEIGQGAGYVARVEDAALVFGQGSSDMARWQLARGRDLVTGLVVRGLIVAEMSSEGVAVRAGALNQRLASQLVGDGERSGAGKAGDRFDLPKRQARLAVCQREDAGCFIREGDSKLLVERTLPLGEQSLLVQQEFEALAPSVVRDPRRHVPQLLPVAEDVAQAPARVLTEPDAAEREHYAGVPDLLLPGLQ